jgi:ABC-type transporter Mla MlaB component
MKHQTDEENGRQVLRLEGDLGIEQAGELRELFVRQLVNLGPLKLNLDKVETAHVTCLQILCSAHRTFWGSGRSLTLDGSLPPRFSQALDDAGFNREKGCPLDSSRTCLFASGGES